MTLQVGIDKHPCMRKPSQFVDGRQYGNCPETGFREISSKPTYRELAPKSRRGKDYAGTDFIVARNGRIASVYLFFDELP
jgi:hypothetical protein